ncbi:MAG: hypothetical protein WAO55_05160 [Candidatus Manganitrophaceae bacterium]
MSSLDQGAAQTNSEVIQVVVKPVITSGFQSEDEEKWGVDLSAYFTTFEVKIINKTSEEIAFDPDRARLYQGEESVFPVLNGKEAVQYYMTGSGEPVFTIFPKSKAIVEAETKKILEARMEGGIIAPGEKKEGLIFFKKISPRQCKELVLKLSVAVTGSGETKEFSFPFSCGEP